MNKPELRKKFLNIRKNFDGGDESLKICENILKMKEYKAAETIAAFIPYKSEANIMPFISEALKVKRICFPVTDENDNLNFYFADDISQFKIGKYEILQPPETNIAEHIDFMLVPGIVFDINGFRIGYGKGCYDRYLNGKDLFTCAVGYAFQLTENIEHDAHDAQMRAFVDEKEILYF